MGAMGATGAMAAGGPNNIGITLPTASGGPNNIGICFPNPIRIGRIEDIGNRCVSDRWSDKGASAGSR
jgi:hypothetical protein